MPLGFWAFVGWLLLVTLLGTGFLIWGWQSGQFRNIEEPKYRMLEDREPEPWPNRKEYPSRKSVDRNGGAR